jgi:hypothetical protein
VIVGLWLPFAAWELSRKIRVPEDETSYRTYSKVLGWKVASRFSLPPLSPPENPGKAWMSPAKRY